MRIRPSSHVSLLGAGFFVAILAACSGGAPVTPSASPAQPSSSIPGTISVPFSSVNVATQLPSVAGYNESITLPSNNAAAGTALQLGISLSASAGVPAASSSLPVRTAMLYFSARTQQTVVLKGYPAFSIIVPSSVQLDAASQQVQLALYDPDRGWSILAAGSIAGRTITLQSAFTQATLKAGETYQFLVFSAQVIPGCPIPSPTPTVLYVADDLAGSTLAFGVTANGNVAPSRVIQAMPLGDEGPVGVATDAAGNTAVCYDEPAIPPGGTVAVYLPNANGIATPTRSISGSATMMNFCWAVGSDAAGDIYELDRFNPSFVPPPSSFTINVFSSTANGNVAPLRHIGGSSTNLSSPLWDITVDTAGNAYVSGSNAIYIFGPTQNGNVAPIRTIVPPDPGLISGLGVDPAGNLYAANEDASKIYVFAAGANGMATPTRTISGSNTMLNFPTGLAVDTLGRIYVGSNLAPAVPKILVFSAGANGNATPVQVITGSKTTIQSTRNLAVH